jgi:hypothetical protein
VQVRYKTPPTGGSDGFHQGWCNSLQFVNKTLQKRQIVLVSDAFSKDLELPAVLFFLDEVDAVSGNSARQSLGSYVTQMDAQLPPARQRRSIGHFP